MGLFDKRDKKRKDDFDSPVEQVDLGASPPAKAASEPVAKASEPATPPPTASATPAQPATTTAATAPRAAPNPAPSPAQSHPMETDDYGIEKAIELMRTLPSDNVELVVQVVKFSLESVGIKLPTIIEDATRRQKDIQGKVTVRKNEIAELEQEIQTRKGEIDRLEADYRETTTVRERLELAEQIGKSGTKKPAPTSSPEAAAPAPSAPAAAAAKVEPKDRAGRAETAPPVGRPNDGIFPRPAVIPTKK